MNGPGLGRVAGAWDGVPVARGGYLRFALSRGSKWRQCRDSELRDAQLTSLPVGKRPGACNAGPACPGAEPRPASGASCHRVSSASPSALRPVAEALQIEGPGGGRDLRRGGIAESPRATGRAADTCMRRARYFRGLHPGLRTVRHAVVVFASDSCAMGYIGSAFHAAVSSAR